MDLGILAIVLVVALSICAFVMWLIVENRKRSTQASPDLLLLTERVQNKEREIEKLRSDFDSANKQLEEARARYLVAETQLQEERKSAEEKLKILHEAKQKLEESFKSLSHDALMKNTQSFMEIATNTFKQYQDTAKNDLEHRQKSIDLVIKPLAESLKEVDAKIQELEKTRVGAYESLTNQVGQLIVTQNKLQQALRMPTTRGKWGEIQLRRVVELAGMSRYCDFVEQGTIDGQEKRLRPDMIVSMPGNKNVVVDSKVPLHAYLNAIEANDEDQKKIAFKEHARLVKSHVVQLSSKAYWEALATSPDFVVMFLPNDAILNAAAEEEPSIMDSIQSKVLIATPMTLIALLQTVAYVWKQETIAENATKVSDLGRTLYGRIRTLTEHFTNIRKGLERAVEAYNGAASSIERSVLVTARKFNEFGVTDGKDIEALEVIDTTPRPLSAPDMVAGKTIDVSPLPVDIDNIG